MKRIIITNDTYNKLTEAKLTFQRCDKKEYSNNEIIRRLLDIASSEGFW